MTTSFALLAACVVIFTLVAAIWDQRKKRLPNVLTVPAFFLGLLFHLVRGGWEAGWSGAAQGLGFSLAGFATGFGILFVLWLIGGGGGGDVKFMGALGAWLGASMVFQVFILGTCFVVIGTIGIAMWGWIAQGFMRTQERYFTPLSVTAQPGLSRTEAETKQRVHRRLMPLGVPVALATWIILAISHFMTHAG